MLALVIITAMLFPRIFELNKFVTTDETIWIMRSSNFYYALGQREFENTSQSGGTIGAFTMWVATAAYLIEYPEYRGMGQGYFEFCIEFNDYLDRKGIDPLVIVTTSRVITVVILSIVIGISFVLTKKMIGVYPALLGFLLISFDPWYLALSRISHTDAPQATFQFVSLLAFISFVHFGRKPMMLIVSGFLGGIALLAKIMGLTSGLVVVFLSLLSYFEDIIRDRPKRVFGYFLAGRKHVKTVAIWTLFFFLAFAVFYPVVWVEPLSPLLRLLQTPISKVSSIVNSPTANLTLIADDFGQAALTYYSRYIRGYIWRTTPVILLGLAGALFAYLFKLQFFIDKQIRKVIQALFWFAVVYTVVMTIPPKSSPRYYLSVHLILDLVAGMGLAAIILELSSRLNQTREKLFSYSLAAIFLSVQLAGVLPTFPYYFTYYNPLMGGSKRAGETLFIGVGEGLNLAAEYLNDKPDAEDLTVLSWYGIGPLSFFFDGETETFYVVDTWTSKDMDFFLNEFDYLVTYSNQWMRGIPKDLMVILEDIEPEHTVWINDIEYARVYSVSFIKSSLID